MNDFFLKLILLMILSPPLQAYDLLFVSSQNSSPYIEVEEIMLANLAERGIVEGENLNIKYWSLGNRQGMAQRVWMSERDNYYDLIFLNGTVALENFRKFALADERYKFLFGTVTDPVGIGVIDNMSSLPRFNFTGVAYPIQVRERLRFIQAIMPEVRKIGLIYANMPQSRSYRKWIEDALSEEEFSNLEFHYRIVEFIPGERGHTRMIMLSEKYIEELDSKVDIFLTPNDQMGIQPEFTRTVKELSNKPLVGLGSDDVLSDWGACVSIFPDLEEMGKQLALMMEEILLGGDIREIQPQWAQPAIAINLRETEKLGIDIPQKYIEKAGKYILY